MRPEQHPRAGLGVAIFSAAAFSTSGGLGRSLIDAGWSPAAAVVVRISIAALVLAVPGAMSMRGRGRALRRQSGLVAGYGLIAVAACQLFYFNAVQRLSVGVALMLEYLGIVLVVAWMWIRHGQRPHRLTICGSAIALAGLALVLGVLGGTHLDLAGVLWGLGAAVGLAAYFVLGSRDSDNLPPLALASTGMGIGAVTLLALGAMGALPMHATFGMVAFAGHRVSWLIPMACLSLIAAVIAYVAGIAAARMLGPRLASFIGLTEVVFAVLVAWVLVSQLPTATQLGGGALIVGGIALVRIDEMRTQSAPPARPAPARPPSTAPPAGRRAGQCAPSTAPPAGRRAGQCAPSSAPAAGRAYPL